ncbi:flippase-like domain-containing protein, partial [Lacrimispora saccharolytica]|nr:flippase-like domain-containing protein [Lacrimispora saccharolytica]
AVLTITAVLKGGGVSPGELATDIRNLLIPGLLLAVSGMFGFIFFEGMALTVIVRSLGYPAKHRQGFVYSAGDIYFSAITPSASGGQPASALFMIRDGIPTTAVMAALLLNLIMYTMVIITIVLFTILLFRKI